MATKVELSKDTTIDRFAFDSYPVTSIIKVNSIPVNMEGWDVYLYYTEIQPDLSAIEVRITGVVTNAAKGTVKFYPRTTYCYDITNSVAYVGLAVAGTHDYSIVRKKMFYEQNDAGDYVYINIDSEYVLYDSGNPEHDGLQRYSTYIETMTHAVGKIEISARAGT